MKVRDTEIKIIKGDLTKQNVDAIVMETETPLIMELEVIGPGKGKKEAKKRTRKKDVIKQGPMNPGDIFWTQTGRYKAEYVIHVMTINRFFKTDQHTIREACGHALNCARQLGVETVALPALGCRFSSLLSSSPEESFPVIGSAKIMSQEILKMIRFEKHNLKKVVICLDKKDDHKQFEQAISGYLTHVQDTLGDGPYVTVDAVIEYKGGLVLIERSNPPYGWALPGGFVDYGESLEQAVAREAKEETGLELTHLRQFHTYSDPRRDPRFHTVTTVFAAKGKGQPCFGDDAKGLKVVKLKDLLKIEYAFDHKEIVKDYLAAKRK